MVKIGATCKHLALCVCLLQVAAKPNIIRFLIYYFNFSYHFFMININPQQIKTEIAKILKFSTIFNSYYILDDLDLQVFISLYNEIIKKHSVKAEVNDLGDHVRYEFSIINNGARILFYTTYFEKKNLDFDFRLLKNQLLSKNKVLLFGLPT